MQAVRSRAVGEDKSCTSVALSKFLIVNRTKSVIKRVQNNSLLLFCRV